jgi:AcrR family transcriptional regulator
MPKTEKPAANTKAAAKKTDKPAPRVRRDPAKTRASILRAAIAEFAAKGFSGARTDTIARRAKTNIRMLYHYFGGKDALYVCVLEEVLAQLRHEELQLDFDDVDPLDGILSMFDFIDNHFLKHPELQQLLAFENLNRAQHLKRSTRIPQMASPVLELLRKLLKRGEANKTFRRGIDPLHLYVTMVSVVDYGKSHGFTLSHIFRQDLFTSSWQADHREQMHQMLTSFLMPPATPAKRVKRKA